MGEYTSSPFGGGLSLPPVILSEEERSRARTAILTRAIDVEDARLLIFSLGLDV